MRLLVLGGTHFVGRAGVEALHADRLRSGDLGRALDDRTWDAVIDTWAGAPVVVRDSAALLSGHVGHYGYVSSASVYTWPIPLGADETAPTVAADPRST